MNYADEIRRQAEAATRAALPAVTAALWRAYSDGKITEAEAEALSAMVDIRLTAVTNHVGPTQNGCGQDANAAPERQSSPRRPSVGSRPRTDASMERRRRWAASGRLPPAIAARFTLAEQAVLALVAAEVVRRKDCRLSVPNLAAVTGVAETTVRNAIREARKLGLLTVEERQITGFRNDTNIVRIVSPEWMAWLRLARKGNAAWPTPVRREGRHAPASEGIGCKSAKRTPTEVPDLGKTRPAEPKKGCRQAAGDLDRSGRTRIRAGGGAGRAMR
ncbi:hypothetical protein MBRA_06385 [Methylobacterium brachiatum]|nr:hypothetical protein MBRA_06385 [Methylobacterium brachiatum]